MKKVHIISLIAIITITCLQGFNIFLQYKNYAFEEMDKINETLYSSIDEELNLRNRKAIQPDKLGEQHFIYKECTPNERNITNGDKEIDLRVFDAKELKRKGLIVLPLTFSISQCKTIIWKKEMISTFPH